MQSDNVPRERRRTRTRTRRRRRRREDEEDQDEEDEDEEDEEEEKDMRTWQGERREERGGVRGKAAEKEEKEEKGIRMSGKKPLASITEPFPGQGEDCIIQKLKLHSSDPIRAPVQHNEHHVAGKTIRSAAYLSTDLAITMFSPKVRNLDGMKC